MVFAVTEHLLETPRHTTFYLSCGATDAPPIIFVHGWPELSLSWRHQLPCFASLGFRAIAPDMRGYGRSSVYRRHEDYALEHAVADMLELLASLGREQAVWVGHDWGAPVVWSIASHHPERCVAVANLCVPYFANGFCPENLVPYVDRDIHPVDAYPVGQWDYQYFYQESFDGATRGLPCGRCFARATPKGWASPRGWRRSARTAAGSAARVVRPMYRSIPMC
jgi:pimeloyl-ACP methyl ester carboxylesterase